MLLQREYNDSEFNNYLTIILNRIPNNFKDNIKS